MAEIVNLRRARKAKARDEAAAAGAANRHVFGRSKQERSATAAELGLEARRLDSHLREGAAKGSELED